MIVYVRFNSNHPVEVEVEEGTSVSELKETVGRLQGVQPDQLRVIFAGRELCSDSTLQAYDLPEQSTVHVVLPPAGSARRSELVLQRRLSRGVDSLTRLDLSASRLPATSTGLAVILENEDSHTQTGPKPHSTFYVYCKTVCKSVQPGKLRVRCRTCKQGTLTLSRGPSCWDDVLLPDRIHGVCQSEDCDGRVAEFYLNLHILQSTIKSVIKKWKEYGTTTRLASKVSNWVRRTLVREAPEKRSTAQMREMFTGQPYPGHSTKLSFMKEL
ncbi:hypothetical protein PGIGA_G00190640 [Pangasianodon gigas]|uniref:Uncharacterized protein n=1 Tax=Pangasianodon gigas TaxID=30993 RepID=A0ACC5WE66_PANGG|nr:hypothetical protein [Pangasianodon gigas]